MNPSVRRAPVRNGFRPRHLVWLLLLGMLSAGAWSAWHWLKSPQAFPVRNLVVEGKLQHVQVAQVVQRSKPYLAAGFLWFDPMRLRQAVGQIPWVDQVLVWREWPDQVRIRVVEQKPVARWPQDGTVYLMNGRGELFLVAASDIPANLPLLQGPAGQEQTMLSQLMSLNQQLRTPGVRVTSLGLDPRGSWRCILNGHIHLALGRIDPFGRLKNWLAIYPQIRSYLGPDARIDLRYENGFAMVKPAETGTREKK